MSQDIKLSRTEAFMRSVIQKYDHRKYWKYRFLVVDPNKGSRIGNDVKIGAGCVVYRDVPDGATVVCAESRIIIKEKQDEC